VAVHPFIQMRGGGHADPCRQEYGGTAAPLPKPASGHQPPLASRGRMRGSRGDQHNAITRTDSVGSCCRLAVHEFDRLDHRRTDGIRGARGSDLAVHDVQWLPVPQRTGESACSVARRQHALVRGEGRRPRRIGPAFDGWPDESGHRSAQRGESLRSSCAAAAHLLPQTAVGHQLPEGGNSGSRREDGATMQFYAGSWRRKHVKKLENTPHWS